MSSFPPNSALARFKNCHKGQRAWIVGNGPSLKKTAVTGLRKELLFGANCIFNHPTLRNHIDYYFCFDKRLLREIGAEINAYQPLRTKFHSRNKKQWLVPGPKTYLYTGLPFGSFSYDPTKGICYGHVITYDAIQMAYYMGCDPVYLVGCDTEYTGHFLPEAEYYCGSQELAGQQDALWRARAAKAMGLVMAAFGFARTAFKKAGRHIYNATVGGKLEVFERVDHRKVLA